MNKGEPTLDLGGIVLSGGKSTRMGKDKGFVLYEGKPLVCYSIDLLKRFTSDIIISANHDTYRELEYPVVEDEFTNCGPAAGLHAALKASSHEWNMVLSCDVPFVTDEVIFRLLDERKGKGVVPFHDGSLEPLVALYHRGMYAVFEESLKAGRLMLRKIIQEAEMYLVPFDDIMLKNPRIFDNFNSPLDLKR